MNELKLLKKLSEIFYELKGKHPFSADGHLLLEEMQSIIGTLRKDPTQKPYVFYSEMTYEELEEHRRMNGD